MFPWQTNLHSAGLKRIVAPMSSPSQPVTLSVSEIEELARHFSAFRHDVNGCLALVVAATELIRYNPDVARRMTTTLVEQPPKIAGKLREFIHCCERALGLQPDPASSWTVALGRRAYSGPDSAAQPVTVEPKPAKSLHGETLQLNKELATLGFMISGARALSGVDAALGPEALAVVGAQFNKAALKFDQLASQLEQMLNIVAGPGRRLVGGTPSGPMVLTADEVALFQRRLLNLERDVREPVAVLIELGRLVRRDPSALQTRAAEFAQAPPAISAELQTFAEIFDRTFRMVRAAH